MNVILGNVMSPPKRDNVNVSVNTEINICIFAFGVSTGLTKNIPALKQADHK